ncbi:MAG: hypothetical protein L3J75_01380 [Methylococcaceae bacterium]|nr:hypothetical protein [Methylococcaceae bacterium]
MLPTLRLLFFYLAAPPLLLGCILFFAIDNQPITQYSWSLTQSDIERAKSIVSNTSSKARKTIQLSENDLNIAISYLLNYYLQSTSKITVNDEHLGFKISLFLNNNYFGNYVNLSFNLAKQQGYPTINSLQIGKIKIANEFAGLIVESIIKYTPLKEYYILAAQHIRDIQINSKVLTISYITSADLKLKKTLSLSGKNFQPIIFYQRQITHIIAQHNPRWRLSLAELLQPLFKLAYQRSTEDTAISENRALLIAISTYVNKSEIQAYIPFDISPVTKKQYPASLYKRTDMAKHFMASAVLAASGAETLAHILGQEKELSDAKRGSGFSFVDLAGDRAGLRFGQTATVSASKARELQKRMANIKDYTAFMPEVRDLPESMNSTVFKQKFESVYSAKYQAMLKKIDLRISKLNIYDSE